MKNTLLRNALVAIALIATVAMAAPQPARADTASTTRTILYAVAGVAALATIANVEHKNATANTIQGYLPDGSTVYADGRVVARNGQTWYPGNQGLSVTCNGQACQIVGNGTAYNNGNGYYNGTGYNNGSGYNDGAVYNNGTVYSAYNGDNARRHGRGHGHP